jgi:peptide/nickel transport system substrate-binding protein
MLMRTVIATLAGLVLAASMAIGLPYPVDAAPEGQIVIAQGADPTTLDPHMHAENYTFAIVHNLFDHLVQRSVKNGQLAHDPELATSWTIVNPTTWEFKLRHGVKFHDGEDFNGDAVKFSIERVLNPAQKARWRWAFADIDRVDVVDAYTVRIVTKRPLPTLITNLAFAMPIVPPKYVKEKGDAYVATHPVGTGPFKFVRWSKDEQMVLEANEGYWRGAPKVKQLIFRPIPDESTRVAALMTGQVDIARGVPPNLVKQIESNPRTRVAKVPSALNIAMPLDTIKEGPLRDKRVRQAINHGVDKENIIRSILEGNGSAVGGTLTPVMFGYDPNIKPYPYDPERAKRLLAEANYPQGISLTLNVPSGRYLKDKEVGEAIAGQLQKIGVRAQLVVQEWGTYVTKMPDGLSPMYMIGWAGTWDADGTMFPLLHTGERFSRWSNPEFDRILDAARVTLDQNERLKLYSQAGRLVHEEAPWLFLFNGMDIYGVNRAVTDWEPTSDEGTATMMLSAGKKK